MNEKQKQLLDEVMNACERLNVTWIEAYEAIKGIPTDSMDSFFPFMRYARWQNL